MLHIVTGLLRFHILVLIVSLAACDTAPTNDEATNPNSVSDEAILAFANIPDDTEAGVVEYHLRWDRSSIDTDMSGWAVTTNEAYRVTLQSGWLSNYRITLAACAPSAWWHRLLPRSAYAADGAEVDSSESLGGVIEDLSVFADQLWTQRPLGAHDYCRFHHLLARADETSRDRPMQVDINRVTLIVIGYAEKDGEIIPFEVRSSFAHGMLLNFNELAIIGSGEGPVNSEHGIQVLVERRPAAWFDNIDFAAMNERQLAHQIGTQILESTRYAIRILH